MAKSVVASTSGSAVSVPVSSNGSTVSSPKPVDPDLSFAFDKKGNVRPQYCYSGRFLYDYDEVKKWFECNKPSISYKRHGLVYLRKY
ncbi:MAG TPA: hypothetical protein VNA15_05080 [Candidatus Angelobacter sp.]|nr:hypothetical protein [Candidatus Angelobacter sp.]